MHIPKCAGVSVEAALKHPEDGNKQGDHGYRKWDEKSKLWVQHATADQIKSIYCHNYDQYFSFTFVRNPWSKLVSDYFWLSKELNIKDTFKNFTLLANNFNTPRLAYPHVNEEGRGDHLILQTDYILDSNGEEIVNYIGRFETLQQDFDIVCDKIGIPQRQLQHRNKSKHKHYTEYYNEETKQIVAEKYKKDIEYFGYKFEE